MIKQKILVTDKKEGLRPIKFKDIVILLRSTKTADVFERELLKRNIPVFTDGGAEYLETVEIGTIMNLLKILDNPLDDISLVAVLRSMIFGFTDNEIIEIRLINRETSFWNSINEAIEKLENLNLKNKLINFKSKIEEWRYDSKYQSISELIWKIYVETGYYNYVALMPNGSLRQANLKMLFERARDYEKTSFKGLFNFIRFIEKLRVGSSDLSSAKIIGENEDVVRIMSIHKSKGLEFPVVFLSNTSKKMNLEDLKGDILFHQDLGIGAEYINYERKISYSTSSKLAIKVKLKEENISEEMRILYVALTRAKEKLIITGVRADETKELAKKKEELKVYIKDKKINPILLKKYNQYLDWIELTYLKNEILGDDVFDFNVIKFKDITEEEHKEEAVTNFNFSEYNNFKDIEKKLNWQYSNISKTKLPIKTTVSTIKELENEGVALEDLENKNMGLSSVKLECLNEEKIDSARLGTLTHLVLQKIDFNEKDVKSFLQKMVAKNYMKQEETAKIRIDKIEKFLKSDLAEKIRNSKKVFREKPFYMKINADKILEEAKGETILVQGIIDLFFEDENGEIVLVDYKTDHVKEEKELIDRYKIQLELYNKALEKGINKRVSKTYIYSFGLDKKIEFLG